MPCYSPLLFLVSLPHWPPVSPSMSQAPHHCRAWHLLFPRPGYSCHDLLAFCLASSFGPQLNCLFSQRNPSWRLGLGQILSFFSCTAPRAFPSEHPMQFVITCRGWEKSVYRGSYGERHAGYAYCNSFINSKGCHNGTVHSGTIL